MAVRGSFRNRFLRSAITCTLVVLQVHLFWLTIFHHHESPLFPLRPATVQQGSHVTPLSGEAGLLCTACQIVRHSALRPTISPQAPQLASSVPLRLAVLRDHLRSPQRIVVFGRAPPLA